MRFVPSSPDGDAISDRLYRTSKREYLLAQIRQKDIIIEKLLREVCPLPCALTGRLSLNLVLQLHNPYTATPLSIASYRMATSPSDKNNRDVIAWLDRLEESVAAAGGSGGADAFKMDSRGQNDDDDDSDGEHEGADATERGSANGQEGADAPSKDGDDTLTPLPDTSVPLGLLASLSLSAPKNGQTKKKKSPRRAGRGDSSDDDDVVSLLVKCASTAVNIA